MIISVRNIDLRRQQYKTSCWVSSAHFVLRYLNVDVTLQQLHSTYYSPDGNSLSLMSGAGHPKTILNQYVPNLNYSVESLKAQSASKSEFIDAIVSNIQNNIPVIAAVRSAQIQTFGHALVITAISPETGTIGFKDPAAGTSPRPFGVDVRTVTYNEFIAGFSYRYAQQMQVNVFAYCTEIIYLKPV